MKLFPGITLALACIPTIVWGQPAGRDAGEVVYIVNGRSVALERSDSSRAFRVSAGRDADFQAAVERIPGFHLEPLSRYGLVLVRAPIGGTFEGFDTGIASVGAGDLVEAEMPVYQSGRIQMLLVNQFMVRFREFVDEAAARALIADDLGAEIVRDDEREKGRFAISFPGMSAEEALPIVNELNSNPLVREAYPEFVRIYPPRTGRLEDLQRAGIDDPEIVARVESGAQGASFFSSCTPATASSGASVPHDPYFSEQWALEHIAGGPAGGLAGADINVAPAWQSTKGAASVRIAIIDDGVETTHPDLMDKIELPGFDATYDPQSGVPADPNPLLPRDSHGTAVAGIAAAATNNMKGIAGVDWHAKIIPIRLGSTDPACMSDCSWITSADAERRSIEAAVELGANVLINSWTIDGTSQNYPGLEEAIHDALAAGHVVVFAAGNNTYWQTTQEEVAVSFPASLAASSSDSIVTGGLIAVSATNQWDEFKTHVNDQFVPPIHYEEPLWGSNRGPAVTVAAPGVRIYTTKTGGGYDYFCMTSAATPFVGGAAALLLSIYPNATSAEIKSWIEEGAHDLGANGFDFFYGYGRLDVLGALEAAAVQIDLEVESANEPIGWKENRRVWATVTRGGIPVVGLPVGLDIADASYLHVVSSLPQLTNASGIAEIVVRGNTLSSRSIDIAATAGTTTVSRPVKVPTLTGWTVIAFFTLVVVRMRFVRRLAQH